MSDVNEKVSVITVCRNEKNRIRRTIESVLNQKFYHFEYIVIDGDSVDGTQEEVERYRHSISNFVSEPDAGIFSAMNKGARLSQGEYLYFLNAGDTIHSTRLFQEIFLPNVREDLVYGDLVYDHGDNFRELRRQPPKVDIGYLLTRTIYHPAVFIKRSFFLDSGGYDETFRIAGDYEFMVRAILHHRAKTRYVPCAFADFDTTGVSSDLANSKEHIAERLRIQKRYFPIHYYYLSRFRFVLMKHRDKALARYLLSHGYKLYRLFRPV